MEINRLCERNGRGGVFFSPKPNIITNALLAYHKSAENAFPRDVPKTQSANRLVFTNKLLR